MYLSLVLCLLFPLLLLHAAPEPSTRDDTAHSQHHRPLMTLMPSQTMSQQRQQQQRKEPDVAGSFHNGTDSEGLVASVTPQRLREADQGGAMATEGGAMTTEGGAMATEGGAMTTEGGAMATEGGAMATEGGAMATEGGAMAMESGAAGTEGGAMATEGGGMATKHGGTAMERGAMATEGGGTATEGGAMATEGGAAGTEAGAVATEGDYEGDDVFVEAPDEDYAVLFPRDDGGDGGDGGDDGDGDEAVERIFEAAVDDASDVFTLPNLLDDLVRAEMSELMPSDDDYDDDDDDDGGAPDDIVDSMVDNSIVHRRRGSLYPDYQDLGASSSSTGEGRDPDYAAPMGVLINEARREMEDSRGLRDELGGSLVDVDGLPEAEVGLEAERGDLQRLVNKLSVVNGDAESQTR